jgi:hypothetical protein
MSPAHFHAWMNAAASFHHSSNVSCAKKAASDILQWVSLVMGFSNKIIDFISKGAKKNLGGQHPTTLGLLVHSKQVAAVKDDCDE